MRWLAMWQWQSRITVLTHEEGTGNASEDLLTKAEVIVELPLSDCARLRHTHLEMAFPRRKADLEGRFATDVVINHTLEGSLGFLGQCTEVNGERPLFHCQRIFDRQICSRIARSATKTGLESVLGVQPPSLS